VPRPAEDPAYTSSRREAVVVFVVLFAAMAYTVTYCWLNGYDRDVDDLTFVLGFPDWVFWGIVVPWAVCIAFSLYFGAVYMRDEQLVDDPGEDGSELRLEIPCPSCGERVGLLKGETATCPVCGAHVKC
jgi:hypothetical protein